MVPNVFNGGRLEDRGKALGHFQQRLVGGKLWGGLSHTHKETLCLSRYR